jgi:hypothetical protein
MTIPSLLCLFGVGVYVGVSIFYALNNEKSKAIGWGIGAMFFAIAAVYYAR